MSTPEYSLDRFAHAFHKRIAGAIRYWENEYRSLSRNAPIIEEDDVFESACCRYAVYEPSDSELEEYGIMRAAGIVQVGKEEFPHAFFAPRVDHSLVLDFTAGQFALYKGQRATSMMKESRSLFRLPGVLLGTKRDIDSQLGIKYPEINEDHDKFFKGLFGIRR